METILDCFCIIAMCLVLLIILIVIFAEDIGEEIPLKNKLLRIFILLFLAIFPTSYSLLRIDYEKKKSYENVVYEILSLKNSSSVEGHFALGYGRIETISYYFFYVEDEKGYKLEKIKSERTYIKPLEDSVYNVPTITKKKIKGEIDSYHIIYLPQEYIVFDYNI